MLDLNLHPRTKVLRQFALVWLLLFLALGCYNLSRAGYKTQGTILLIIALPGMVGLIWPIVIRPIYQLAVLVTFPIGWMVSQTVLILMFYGILTPLGLVLRCVRSDPLTRKKQANSTTYWSDKPQPSDLRSYFRQY